MPFFGHNQDFLETVNQHIAIRVGFVKNPKIDKKSEEREYSHRWFWVVIFSFSIVDFSLRIVNKSGAWCHILAKRIKPKY